KRSTYNLGAAQHAVLIRVVKIKHVLDVALGLSAFDRAVPVGVLRAHVLGKRRIRGRHFEALEHVLVTDEASGIRPHFSARGMIPVVMTVDDVLHRDIKPLRQFSLDRKSTRLNSSHVSISYAVFCLKKKK